MSTQFWSAHWLFGTGTLHLDHCRNHLVAHRLTLLSDPGSSLRPLASFCEELQFVAAQSEIPVASREMPHRSCVFVEAFPHSNPSLCSGASVTRSEVSPLLSPIDIYSRRVVSGGHKGLHKIWGSDEHFSYDAWQHCQNIGLSVTHCGNSRRRYSLFQRTLPRGLPTRHTGAKLR